MTDHSTTLYLNLLKKSLTDYLNVRSAYANGVPPEFWFKKSPLKNLRNRLLVRWLKRSKMVVLRVDNISPDEREKLRREGEDWPLLNAQTMVGLDRLDNIQNLAETILVEAETLLQDPNAYHRMATAISPFGDGSAAEKIIDLLVHA